MNDPVTAQARNGPNNTKRLDQNNRDSRRGGNDRPAQNSMDTEGIMSVIEEGNRKMMENLRNILIR